MPAHVHQAFIVPSFSVWQINEILPRFLVLRPQQQFPRGQLCHWWLKAEICCCCCCCWLPCCWTSLHSGRCFCFSQATESLTAPFLLPPGTPDHLLLAREAEGTTYTRTTLFFEFFLLDPPECEQADALQSCVVLTQLMSLSLYLWKRLHHHVVPHGFQIHPGAPMKCFNIFWTVSVFFCKTLLLCLKR